MKQLSMFESDIKIPGLTYIPEYITANQEAIFLETIDSSPWIVELKRRVQHYGYKYDYKTRTIDRGHYLGPIPEWLSNICDKLKKQGMSHPDQIIVNEYLPGQGISSHIDCVPCFGSTICSLSLGSSCVMDFTKLPDKRSILLEPRSLLILRSDSRYLWKHGIAYRKIDKLQSIKIKRERRISLTFRNVTVPS